MVSEPEAIMIEAKEDCRQNQASHDDPLLDCLVEITRLHGVPQGAAALSAGLPLECNRLTPSLLLRAASRARFSARLLKRRLDGIEAALLPAILILKGNRACVLLGAREGGYLVCYPEVGASAVQVTAEQLEHDYHGTVCFLRPQFRYEARLSDIGATRRGHWFWSAVHESRGLYRDALVAAVLINVFALCMPLFTMNVYDRVLPNNAVDTLWVLVVGIALVLIFNFLLTTVRSHVVDAASKRIDVKLSALIMERVLNIRMEHKPASVGAFASNLRSFEAVRDFIASASLTTLVDLPFIVLFLAVLAWISPWLMLPPFVAIVLALIVSFVAQARMETFTTSSFQAASQRNATLIEALVGLETIKALNGQSTIQHKWEHATRYIAQLGASLRLVSTTTVNLVLLMQQLVSVSVLTIGVYLVHEAALSMGGIIAASMIAGRCLAPLSQVAGLLLQYHNAKASLASIGTYMEMPVERTDMAAFLDRPAPSGDIEFRDLSFTYPDTSQPALRNINLRIAAGERVGIIGRIGSGKTTLEKMILSLYAPTEGAVLFDGVDARQLDPAALRRAIGYVPQDPMLFYGSLKQNIAMNAPFAEDEAILKAAALAGVTEFANAHPQGFDMLVGERGESLSGGQRQSVAIARALASDPSILLLDEPSSNMDNVSELRLKKRLESAAAGKTMVLVTHRTALLDLVDRLIIVDGGRIVADGPRHQVISELRGSRLGPGVHTHAG